MRKATREFLAKLAPISGDTRYIKVLQKKFNEAQPRRCYSNAMLFLKSNEKFYLRSGWLVGEYLGESGTAIMPHYWVYDGEKGIDYDVTPILGDQKYEYILDMEIIEHVDGENLIAIPASIKMTTNGEILVRLAEDQYVKTDTVNYGELFALAAQAQE